MSGMVLWELATRQFPYDEFKDFFTERKEVLSESRRKNIVVPSLLITPTFSHPSLPLLIVQEMESMRASGWTIDMAAGVATKSIAQKSRFIDAIVHQDLRPSIPTDVPRDITALIQRCWKRIPSERPTMQEIGPPSPPFLSIPFPLVTLAFSSLFVLLILPVSTLKKALTNWRHSTSLDLNLNEPPPPSTPPVPPPRQTTPHSSPRAASSSFSTPASHAASSCTPATSFPKYVFILQPSLRPSLPSPLD